MMYPFRFVAFYAALGAVALAAIFAAVLIAFTPITPVAHKGDLGPTTSPALVAQAEKSLAQALQANGAVVLSQHVVSVDRPDANTIKVTIKFTLAGGYDHVAVVTLSRGIWRPDNLALKS